MSSNNASSRNFIQSINKYDRIILLVDMDCFYCQVEEKLDPSLKGQPVAVCQYNSWKGGGIIAVNYAARAKGVTRHMRGDEAKEQCPEIQLVNVPNVREKADLTKYREAGKDVANVLQRFTPLLERASVDEAYMDITESVNRRLVAMNEGTFILQPQELINTYAVGFPTIGEFVTTITKNYMNPLLDNDDFYRNFHENDIPSVRQSNIKLLIGASLASEIRAAVKLETGYECSAGIAHNKILAKLACGINKPNKQTILPLFQIKGLFETLPVGKIKGLGAKFGEEVCERMGVRFLGQLLKFTELELQRKFDEKNGSWLYNICRGVDLEAVTPRFYSKSIGCCKKFPGRNNITGIKTLQHWLNELATEINERLEKDVIENSRRARQMVVNYIQEFNSEELSSSRSSPLNSYDTEVLAKTSLEIIKSNTKQFFRAGSESVLNNPIKFLGISVGKFETISTSQNNIQDMFAQQAAKKKKLSNDNQNSNEIETSTTLPEKEISLNKAIAAKATAVQKQKQDVRSFFAKALKNQTKLNVAHTSPEDKVSSSNELSDQNQQVDVKKLHDEYTVAAKPLENIGKKTNEKDVAENQAEMVKKSFFKAHIKQDSVNHVSNSHESCNQNQQVDVKKLHVESGVAAKPLENISKKTNDREVVAAENDTTMVKKSFFKTHIKQDYVKTNDTLVDIKGSERENEEISEASEMSTNADLNNSEETTNKMNQIDNSELNDLLNDLEHMPNETTDVLNSDDAMELPSTSLYKKRKFNEMTNETKENYHSEYAEFAIPEFRPEFLQFIKCATCGAKVSNDSMSIQTHEDGHFAQQLSQQQRNEYREEIRSKITAKKTSPNVNKTIKKTAVSNSSKVQKNAGIKQFLKPSSTSLLPNETQDIQNSEFCDKCKVALKPEDVLEHNDFHVAKDLQRKLNQLEVHTVDIANTSISELSRKNANSSIVGRQPAKANAKPITHFFSQSNT